jgi:hypothetical protein
MVEGRNYTARSRHGPANQLARQLVVAGFPDRPMVIRYRGLVGTTTYRSFHAAATWTFSEGERRLRRVRYKEPPEGVFLGSGTGKKFVSSPLLDDVARPATLRQLHFLVARARACATCRRTGSVGIYDSCRICSAATSASSVRP